jgi:hypothetical protein
LEREVWMWKSPHMQAARVDLDRQVDHQVEVLAGGQR